MRWDTYLYSGSGGQVHNDDRAEYQADADNGIWVVSDGTGRDNNGEPASEIAVRCAMTAYRQDPVLRFRQLTEEANRTVCLRQQTDVYAAGISASAVIACVNDGTLRAAHIGNARLYVFRRGQLIYVSQDHTTAQLRVQLGQATQAHVQTAPDRNKLLRFLGNSKPPVAESMPEPLLLVPGDAFLLCTDGFWGLLPETELILDGCKATTARAWVEHLLVRLQRRLDNGADCYTVLACMVQTDE